MPASTCPRCLRQRLEPVDVSGRIEYLCRRCGGLWCEPRDWDSTALGPLPAAGVDTERAPDIVAQGPSDKRCPSCVVPMQVLRVSAIRELAIDQCDRCGGVWFDHAEWAYLEALREWQRAQRQGHEPTTWGQWWLQLLVNLPIELNVRPHRRPHVTVGIITLCVLVFVLSGDALTPVLGLTMGHLASPWGWATLITHEFVHADLIHLLGNMYVLYITGDNVEDVVGHLPFLLLFVLSGALAGGVFLLTSADLDSPLIGASGAISAVLAAYVVLFRRAKLTVMVFFKQFRVPAPVWVGVWFAFNALGALTDPTGVRTHIAFVAHLVGFAAGLLLVWPLRAQLVENHPLLHLLHTGRLGSDAVRSLAPSR